jgi:hypothetical protein
MALLLLLIVLTVFAAIALELGVDSRDESPDPHRSNYPIGLS